MRVVALNDRPIERKQGSERYQSNERIEGVVLSRPGVPPSQTVQHRGLWGISWQTLSEDDLESQLDVEWFAGSDAWCVVARSDGRPDLPKTAGAKRVITQLLWSGVSKVQMIKQIEHLHPELGVDTLRNGSVLEEREIDVFKARPVDAVASVVTIGSKCRVGKCGRVDPLNDADRLPVFPVR